MAEFPSEPFHEITARLFGARKKLSKSASRTYWHLLNLLESAERGLSQAQKDFAESLELQAVEGASAYEDVVPALAELRSMGIQLLIASSLSNAAIARFLERWMLQEIFTAAWGRNNAGGIKDAPLRKAFDCASLDPARTIFLTDTAEGLQTAKNAGVQPILMMNDPDEAKRLAMLGPAGGVVSLYELPDFVRLVAARQ